jgi:hypothetical protein
MNLFRGSSIKFGLLKFLLGQLPIPELQGNKLMSSKLVAQMDEVWQISSALLPEVTVALADLSTSVSSAVDLAVQVSHGLPCAGDKLMTSWPSGSVLMQLLSVLPRKFCDCPISSDS